ncbi:conserved hypothetical protein [[Clostridium] ultunense Esp]|nr:conserved hypothetical protein [[Clostridium] ultunense Esp]
MPYVEETEKGKLYINENVIARIAGGSAMEVFGVVGMASQQFLKDGFAELLGRENLTKGIDVHIVDQEVNLNLYIIVGYGTKISEVAHNVQERIRYALQEIAGISVNKVNIIVQGVRV